MSQIGGTGFPPRFRQPDRPAVARENLARRDRPLAHSPLPVGPAWGKGDLTENDVDHPIRHGVLVGHVLVEGHRHDSELLSELGMPSDSVPSWSARVTAVRSTLSLLEEAQDDRPLTWPFGARRTA